MKGYYEANIIRIASLNIRLGRAGRLEAALRDLKQGNVEVRVLQETRLMDGIHAHHRAGYAVCATVAESRHWGEVTVVQREDAGWQVEGIIKFGPNVASFLLILGSRRWNVVGEYVSPNNAPAVYCMDQALEASPKGVEVILLWDLNAWLWEPCYAQEEDLATELLECRLVDTTSHFMQRRWYRGGRCWMWRMRQEGRQVTGRGDYVLRTDRYIFPTRG